MKVLIDIVPMAAGHGGTGSGIWTYAENLLYHLDRCVPPGMELLVLARRPQISNLKAKILNLKLVPVRWPCKGILARLLWVHVTLPLICLFRRVDVLHKLATETPLFCPARRVTTFHDFYYEFLFEHTPPECVRRYERLENLYFQFVTRLCFRKSRRIIAVSEAIRQEILRRHPAAADRILVIHHGAPPGTEDRIQNPEANSREIPASGLRPPIPAISLQSSACSLSSFTLLYPAKFMTHKGQLSAVKAVETLLSTHPEMQGKVQLVFRGYSNDRHYERRLREGVAASPASGHIRFVSYERTLTTAEIYRGCHALLLLSQYEGFGLPVIEAQSQGLPVICSALPVLHEVAGEAALFVQPDDSAGVATAILTLITDAALRQGLMQRGLANAKRFDWQSTARLTTKVYEDVCHGDRRIRP